MTIAPTPQFPERAAQSFDRAMAVSPSGTRGSLRFEEGLGTDTDVPNDFMHGAYGDPTFAPGRVNHNNPGAQFKHADETMRERAHAGSAAWIEAPTMLQDFAHGAGAGQTMPQFERVMNSGGPQARRAPTVITD